MPSPNLPVLLFHSVISLFDFLHTQNPPRTPNYQKYPIPETMPVATTTDTTANPADPPALMVVSSADTDDTDANTEGAMVTTIDVFLPPVADCTCGHLQMFALRLPDAEAASIQSRCTTPV